MLARQRYWLLDRLAGRSTLHKLQDLESLQWQKTKQLRAIQDSKLRTLLSHAYENCRYYKMLFDSLNISVAATSPREVLRCLPVLTKNDLRGRFDEFKARDYEKYGPRTRATSGSTGEAFHYILDRAAHSWVHAYLMHAWRVAGFDWGDRIFTIGGGNVKLGPLKRRVFSFLRNSTDIPSFDFNEERLAEVSSRLKVTRPGLIYGYGSALALVAKFSLEQKLELCNPKGIVTTAENLLPHNRERIEQAFGCRVFDQYGVMECGATAFECEEHAGYHIGMTKGVLEVVDDAGVPLEESVGRIVCTDLDNYAVPMIRYDTGDLGVLTRRMCACGRGFELLDRVVGRTREFLTAADGTKIHGAVFSYLVRDNPWINQYQVYQAVPGEIILRIISDLPVSMEMETNVRRFIESQSRSPLTVKIVQVDDIPLGPNNKRRFVVSEIENI